MANNGNWKAIIVALVVGVLVGSIAPIGAGYLKLKLFSPDIEVQFETKPPFVILNTLSSDDISKNFSFIDFRIQIENISDYFTANSYSAMLTGLWHKKGDSFVPSENFESLKLTQCPYMPSDVSPGMRIFVPFARIAHPDFQKRFDAKLYSGNPEIPHFRFQVPKYPIWMSSHMEPGIHRFQITIFFENRAPINKMFEFKWPEKRDFNNILSNISIKMYR